MKMNSAVMGFNLKRITALSYDASVFFPETRISWPVRSYYFGFVKVLWRWRIRLQTVPTSQAQILEIIIF